MAGSVRRWMISVALFAMAGAGSSATFVVPTDRDMVRRADAIVIGSVLTSYPQFNDHLGVETVTPFSIQEVIKGRVSSPIIDIIEPGGVLEDRFTIIPGVPRLEPGERLVLFLTRRPSGDWAVTDLVLGKFELATDMDARRLLVRQEQDIVGWDPQLNIYRERRRLADEFLQFVREEARGKRGREDYFVSTLPLRMSADPLAAGTNLKLIPHIAPFTIRSYMFTDARWKDFPLPVTFFRSVNSEPGAPGGGDTAINAALTAWNNDCLSNVNLVYGGVDDGTNTMGLAGPDMQNTILFERNLTARGIPAFQCTPTSYSGTLGLGGITEVSGSHMFGGESFITTTEGDVEMNQGIANCSLLFGNGDFNSAVAHEVGHTLSFRHSDQNDIGGPCDATRECSTNAVMRASIPNGLNATLQLWDQRAVQAVYAGNVCVPGPPCTAPVIAVHPQSTTIALGQQTTLSVTASGTSLSYQWYVGTSGVTTSPVFGATNSTLVVAPSIPTSYWVRVSNSCGTADSNTATVTVTNTPGPVTSFFLVTPCRLSDTRNPVGPYGGPELAPNTVRTYTAAGQCSVPSGAQSIAVNVTAVTPFSSGFLTLYPFGPSGVPSTSTLNYRSGKTLANNAITRLSSDGRINVYNSGPFAIHVIIDVNGYFQ